MSVPSQTLGLLQVRGGILAAAAVGLDVEADLLAFDEAAHAGALERGRMNEDVLAAVVRLNETKALLAVIKLHGTRSHGSPFRKRCARWTGRLLASHPAQSILEESSERAPAKKRRRYGPGRPAKVDG